MNKLKNYLIVLVCTTGFVISAQASTCAGSQQASLTQTQINADGFQTCYDAVYNSSSNPYGDCAAGGFVYNSTTPSSSIQCMSNASVGCENQGYCDAS